LASVKVDFSSAIGQIGEFSKAGAKIAAEELKKEIVIEISEGRSPVKSQGGRFQGYSPIYKTAIDNGRYSNFNKRKRPVNLKLTGRLLRSIFSDVISSSKIRIGFADQLADIHNREGAGKSKVVRRMLPTNQGETFTDTILFRVGTKLSRLAKKIFR